MINPELERFMSRRAFAQFEYDTATKTFKPSVTDPECGYACHAEHVASRDYIFTACPPR